MNLDQIKVSLGTFYPIELVERLLLAYEEMRKNFYLGKIRIHEVEGGRFCEAAFRMLEYDRTGAFTPLGTSLNTDAIIRELGQTPTGSLSDSVRLHIPRTLRVIYDIRNRRDAGHLADGISANEQDAALVLSNCSWVLSEFIRLHHNLSATVTHRIIEELVQRVAPSIQEFGDFLKTLKPKLGITDRILLLLYHCEKEGALLDSLYDWLHKNKNLKRALTTLDLDKDLIHYDGSRYYITKLGEKYVERKRLFDPS